MKTNDSAVDALSEWQQITCGAALVARMQANYRLFCEVTESGDAGQFGNILDLVWEYASGVNTRIDFARQRDKLEAITPDPEQFDMYGVWPALDAAVSLATLLDICERWMPGEIDSLVLLSRSTIERYLEVSGEQGSEQHGYSQHPLVLADSDYLASVLEDLLTGSAGQGRAKTVKALRQMSRELETSNIGLEV